KTLAGTLKASHIIRTDQTVKTCRRKQKGFALILWFQPHIPTWPNKTSRPAFARPRRGYSTKAGSGRNHRERRSQLTSPCGSFGFLVGSAINGRSVTKIFFELVIPLFSWN